MKIITYYDWGTDTKIANEINEFISKVVVYDIKIAMSESHEMMVIMYEECELNEF